MSLLRRFVTLGLGGALLLGCGTEGDPLDVEVQQGEIIGGGAVSDATQTSQGLVVAAGCSGILLDANTAMTATHCVSFMDMSLNRVVARGTDGASKERTASRVVQVGTSDISLIKLTGTTPAGWPTVNRTMSTVASASLQGKNVTCYGRGNTRYVSGGGTTGVGPWRSLTRDVLRYEPAANLLAISTADGTQTPAPNDSGGACFYGTQPAGVIWKAYMQCNVPVPDSSCTASVTKILEAHLTATNKYATYIDAAKNRAAAPFLPFPSTELKNGWKAAGFSTHSPASALDNKVVYLRGAISGGTSNYAFLLPQSHRPSATVYLTVNLANATKGRLQIEPDGKAYVYDEFGVFGNAQGFTSLDGVSFAVTPTAYSTIPLLNGWQSYPTRNVAAQDGGVVVRLQGSMWSPGTNNIAFNLPTNLRPSSRVYLPVDMVNGAKGRLIIDPSGSVTVQSLNNPRDAFNFTSLEGITFAKSGSGFLALSGSNGWTTYSGRGPAVVNRGGIVSLQGALYTNGTSMDALFLPEEFRPATSVYVSVDLCDAKRGRILIKPDGWVTVQAQASPADAKCFTSLEGVQFGI